MSPAFLPWYVAQYLEDALFIMLFVIERCITHLESAVINSQARGSAPALGAQLVAVAVTKGMVAVAVTKGMAAVAVTKGMAAKGMWICSRPWRPSGGGRCNQGHGG